MGEIVVDGLGVVQIEGDVPTEEEQDAIVAAQQPDIEEEPPAFFEQPAPREPQPGPLNIVSPEKRQAVRGKIEEQPGLVQLMAEISPSVGGAILGGALGSPFFPPFGPIVGAMVGGFDAELLAQEAGIAPTSRVNLGLSAGGPVAGAVVGGGLKLGRKAVGAAITRAPFARTALARNTMGRAVEEFESLGTRILARQQGLMTRPAGDLFTAARKAGVVVTPDRLNTTRQAITELQEELAPILAFPEARQASRVLDAVKNTLLNEQVVSLDNIIRARQLVGVAVRRAESAGGIKFGKAKKVFAAISDDLDKIASGPAASKTARAARLAKAATKRAKLEFAVKDLEQGVARFVSDSPDGIRINVSGLQKWLRNLTNPKSRQFDKNFASALEEELPAIQERLSALVKITSAGSPGGPGSIVVRGQTARMGRAVIGGVLGFGVGGTVGGGVGAVVGASAPEMLTGLLTTKAGSAFLTSAARLGKGEISAKAWTTLGQLVLRSAGERDEER